jgi:hypothetical protein
MSRYWFRPKTYGYGVTPVTWEGWAVTFGTALAMVAVSLFLRMTSKSDWALAALVAFDVVALCGLLVISHFKTDGELRWRWGQRHPKRLGS